MRPLSNFLVDQTVDLTLTTWTTAAAADPDGGRYPLATTTRTDVPAAVLPGKPVREITTDPDTGLRRVTVTWPVSVEFPQNVGLSVDDIITWIDEADVTHIYQVRGYGVVAGQPGLWVATCEERM